MKVTKLLLLFFLFLTASCTPKNKPLSENDLIKIYAYHELGSVEENQAIIKEYQLNNTDKKEQYYDKLNSLAIDEQAYNSFLNKVDSYKKNVIANNPKKHKVQNY